MNRRESWVDCAKGIGIVLVVYGHVARGLHSAGLKFDRDLFQVIDSVIYSFHMPLFFFLSGLFFSDSLCRRGRIGVISNKIITIAYPFVLWTLIQGFIEVAFSGYTNGKVMPGDVLMSLLLPRAQFWFLYALLFICIFCALIYIRLDKRVYFGVFLLFFVLYIFRDNFAGVVVFGYIAANAVYFALGVLIQSHIGILKSRATSVLILSGVLFVSGQYWLHMGIDYRYGDGGMLGFGLALVSISFVTAIALVLDGAVLRLLSHLGAASMAIYVLHIIAGSGVRIVFTRLAGVDSVWINLVVGTIGGIGLPLVFLFFIRRLRLNFLFSPPQLLHGAGRV